MLRRIALKVRFFLVGIVILTLASFAQAFDCERPYLRQNLGMSIDVARSRLTSKTEADRLTAAVIRPKQADDGPGTGEIDFARRNSDIPRRAPVIRYRRRTDPIPCLFWLPSSP
jgi:hypothetical protein